MSAPELHSQRYYSDTFAAGCPVTLTDLRVRASFSENLIGQYDQTRYDRIGHMLTDEKTEIDYTDFSPGTARSLHSFVTIGCVNPKDMAKILHHFKKVQQGNSEIPHPKEITFTKILNSTLTNLADPDGLSYDLIGSIESLGSFTRDVFDRIFNGPSNTEISSNPKITRFFDMGHTLSFQDANTIYTDFEDFYLKSRTAIVTSVELHAKQFDEFNLLHHSILSKKTSSGSTSDSSFEELTKGYGRLQQLKEVMENLGIPESEVFQFLSLRQDNQTLQINNFIYHLLNSPNSSVSHSVRLILEKAKQFKDTLSRYGINHPDPEFETYVFNTLLRPQTGEFVSGINFLISSDPITLSHHKSRVRTLHYRDQRDILAKDNLNYPESDILRLLDAKSGRAFAINESREPELWRLVGTDDYVRVIPQGTCAYFMKGTYVS